MSGKDIGPKQDALQDPSPRDDQGISPELEGLELKYSRARRLENAPDSVRWLASRYGKKGDGPVKSLLSSRATGMLFFAIIALAAAYFLSAFLSNKGDAGRIGEERFSASAFWYEERVLIGVHRSGAARDRTAEHSEAPLLRISAATPGGGAATASFPFGINVEEDFRLSIEGPAVKPPSASIRIAIGERFLDLHAAVR